MTGSLQRLRSAEIIAVGSEMLGSTRVDTNSLFLAEGLAGLGIALTGAGYALRRCVRRPVASGHKR